MNKIKNVFGVLTFLYGAIAAYGDNPNWYACSYLMSVGLTLVAMKYEKLIEYLK